MEKPTENQTTENQPRTFQHETEQSEQTEKLFQDLSAENTFTELESLCMACSEQGTTRLLLTKIPHFREIVVMAFECPHCGWRSNEVQSATSISEKGQIYKLTVNTREDLNRQIVKSDSATMKILELDFEVPSQTQRGVLNTVEGYLTLAWEQLSMGQEERRKFNPEIADQLDKFLERLDKCRLGETPFTLILNDPAGNSFIENPSAPKQDPKLKLTLYKRSHQQNLSIGLTSDKTPQDEIAEQYIESHGQFTGKGEAMIFNSNCSNCHTPCETKMVVVDIPHFKEVIIMATTCDACGFKSNEVKSGGAISKLGKRITLKATDPDDITRSILKSETAKLKIPEVEIEISTTMLGGKFTTIEGILENVKEQFQENPFLRGDSTTPAVQEKFDNICDRLDKFASGSEPFTLILEDPFANSFIQNPLAPDEDPNLIIEEYQRSWEEDEFFGLHDIKTENYVEGTESEKKSEETSAKDSSETK